MKESSPNNEYPAAIHRWFSGGEGWAYHPGLAGTIRELADAVKPELQGRTPTIEKRWSKGWVFGCQVHDDTCQDDHARTRSPTVTRVVSLPKAPAASSREMILGRLNQLTVQEPGVDRALSIQVAPTGLVVGGGDGKSRFWIGVCVAMVVGILVVVSLLALVDPQQHGPSDKNAQKYVDTRIRNLLEEWDFVVPRDAFPAVVREQFFRTLSQFDFDDGNSDHDQEHDESVQPRVSKAEHPDAAFLARLPERKPENLPETHHLVRDLHPELKELAERVAIDQNVLSEPDTLNTKWKQFPQLFKVIRVSMDYRHWFEAHQGHNDLFSVVEEPPGESRKRVVEHFLTGDQRIAGVSKGDVRTMVRQLRKWGFEGIVEDDAIRRPWFVCFWYLAVLSQSHLPKVSPEESWYGYFVSRLPETPSMNPAVRDSSKGFREGALLPLARGLGIDAPSTTLTSTLLTDIEEALAYEVWRGRLERQCNQLAADLMHQLRSSRGSPERLTAEYEIWPYGTVTIEVHRGADKPKVTKRKLKERSEKDGINAFVERFREQRGVQ